MNINTVVSQGTALFKATAPTCQEAHTQGRSDTDTASYRLRTTHTNETEM